MQLPMAATTVQRAASSAPHSPGAQAPLTQPANGAAAGLVAQRVGAGVAQAQMAARQDQRVPQVRQAHHTLVAVVTVLLVRALQEPEGQGLGQVWVGAGKGPSCPQPPHRPSPPAPGKRGPRGWRKVTVGQGASGDVALSCLRSQAQIWPAHANHDSPTAERRICATPLHQHTPQIRIQVSFYSSEPKGKRRQDTT